MTPEASVRCLFVGNFLSGPRETPQVCQDLSARLRESGWPTLTVSSRRNQLLRLLDMTGQAWRRSRHYDVAHLDVFSGRAFWWARAVAEVLQRCGKPYVLTLHGGGLPSFANRHPRSFERLLKRAAAVTAPSSYLVERFCAIRSDIARLPNPINLSRYPFRLRRPSTPRLVWLRAFHDVYDPALAVDVLRRVAEVCPEARLSMAGADRGDGALRLSSRVRGELDDPARVEFVGSIPKQAVPGFLDQGDVYLNTSRVDNAPVSLLEAMACGLPIVSSNAGGIPDLLEDGRDALLLAPGDAEGMAAAVVRLKHEPGLSERLVRNAREKVRRFDWSVVLPEWKRLLGQAARKS